MPESGTMNYLSAAGLDPRRTLEKLRYPPARIMQKGAGKQECGKRHISGRGRYGPRPFVYCCQYLQGEMGRR